MALCIKYPVALIVLAFSSILYYILSKNAMMIMINFIKFQSLFCEHFPLYIFESLHYGTNN